MFFGGPGGFPFGGPGGGGMPGGMGGRMRQQKDVDTTKFYEVLGVPKDADVAAIKKAYRKQALAHHPDRGGDQEKFKEIGKAYEVLSDPEKRKIYDEMGEEGLEGGGGGGHDASDIFEMFFGGGMGGGGRGGPRQKKRGQDVVHPLKVTLEQLYNGQTKKMALNRDIICPECDGHGGPQTELKSCASCNGRGQRVVIRQMGPMIQQSTSPCHDCRGEGKTMPEDKKCKPCKGSGQSKERKVLEVFVEKGAPDRHKITFAGEADEKPGEIPGDLVFVLQQMPHDLFTRKGSNLIMEKKIKLAEALCGFQFHLKHLDGRQLLIQSRAGEITTPDQVKVVRDEGMPTHRNPFVKGHLFIKFVVEFPAEIDEKTQKQLLKLLPRGDKLPVDPESPDLEHHFAEPVDPSLINQQAGGGAGGHAYEEDDDEEEGGPRVACRQQ